MIPHLISVIVPCFNQGRYLPDALDSVLAQTYPHWECIVVNDGSTDNTREIATRYCTTDSRFQYVEQCNRGASAARNAGLWMSKGELLQFLDSDDKLEYDKLLRHGLYLEDNVNVDIVYGDVRYFTTACPHTYRFTLKPTRTTAPWTPALWNAAGPLLMKLAAQNIVAVPCPLIRRCVYTTVGKWNEDLLAVEDWEYWIRCAAKHTRFQFVDIPNTRALVRVHQESTTWDIERVASAQFEMRLAVGKVVTDPHFLLKNCKLAIADLEELGPQGRLARLWKLLRATNTLSAGVPVVTACLFGRYGPAYPLRILMGRFIPWRIQKVFLRLMS